jgi:hypothetical protein
VEVSHIGFSLSFSQSYSWMKKRYRIFSKEQPDLFFNIGVDTGLKKQ